MSMPCQLDATSCSLHLESFLLRQGAPLGPAASKRPSPGAPRHARVAGAGLPLERLARRTPPRTLASMTILYIYYTLYTLYYNCTIYILYYYTIYIPVEGAPQEVGSTI